MNDDVVDKITSEMTSKKAAKKTLTRDLSVERAFTTKKRRDNASAKQSSSEEVRARGSKRKTESVWSPRFKKSLTGEMKTFHSSLPFDKTLYKEDIAGSIAHVTMLGKTGILDNTAVTTLITALKTLEKDIATGKKAITGTSDDIHLWIEEQLTASIGSTGKKLHTARSRNDQVATDVRLYLRTTIDTHQKLIKTLMETLLKRSEEHQTVVMPGYTHLQAAQPISLSFYWLAYFFMLERDFERLQSARSRVNRSPLGAGALAGVNYPIDRKQTMKTLGFNSVLPNAMDAVSDRDFIIEYLSCASIIIMHLSRLCEDLIIYASPNFNFLTLADEVSSGSSIMPNKKNPDSLELIRGKSGRIFGHLLAVLTVMKGLPTAYNRDLQEDKEPLFDTSTHLNACLSLLTHVIQTLTIHPENMRQACKKGFLLATEVADYLVTKGLPFRTAHEVSAALVAYLDDHDKDYLDLSLAEFNQFSPYFTEDIFKILTIDQALLRKKSEGSTSPDHVAEQITLAKMVLKTLLH
ncbi:argininosuccinate lyase [Spirochaetota bacterium]|nr:argininosuccinate lyase [Spirochaetota bacterium]